jgi:hypothetical protein
VFAARCLFISLAAVAAVGAVASVRAGRR